MRQLFLIASFLILTFFAFGSFSVANAEPNDFFSGAEDVPLMPGLEQIFNEDFFIFDKPEGRVVYLKAFSKEISIEEMKNFYFLVLPQLGWQKKENELIPKEQKEKNVFFREKEQLVIMFHIDEESNVLDISIMPAL